MNTHHQTFLNEYRRTRDKKAAYKKAYPKTKDSNLTSSVNRLLARPDIAEEIRQDTETLQKHIKEEVEAHYRARLIGYYEAQVILTKIIRGEETREKAVKQKDGWTTITVTPTISETLRALNTFFRQNKILPLKGAEGDVHSRSGTVNNDNSQKNNFISSGKATQTSPPPWGESEGAPHPFGNIYPPNYPGPYYDPGDPNTKEKLQKLQNQGRHFDWKEKSPEPMQLAQSQRTDNSSKPQEISSPESIRDRNDEPPSTTPVPIISGNNNKTQQKITKENSPPVLRRGGPQDRGGHTQHKQATSTPLLAENRNNSQQKITKESSPPSHGATVSQRSHKPSGQSTAGVGGNIQSSFMQRWYLKEQLRKEGWQTPAEAYSEVYNAYIINQNTQTYKTVKLFEKAYNNSHLPPSEREKLIKETGWEYHPQHKNYLRRVRQRQCY